MDPDQMLEEIMNEKKPAVKAAPAVRTAAKKDGVDLSLVKGTGKSGWITKDDYEAYTGNPVDFKKAAKAEYPMNHLEDNTENIGGMSFNRKRTGFDHAGKKTLDIPVELKNTDLVYRWVNDVGGRVEALKEYGYQTVESSALSKDEKISVRRRVETGKDGSDVEAVLMATPKKWYEDRQIEREARRRKQEDGMFKTPRAENGTALDHNFYNKGSGIRE